MKNIILLAAFLGFSGAAFAQQEVDPAINIEKANQKCLGLSISSYRNACLLQVSKAAFYQTEALETCLIGNDSSDQSLSYCFKTIENQSYKGIFLRSVIECKNKSHSSYSSYSCLAGVNELKSSIQGTAADARTFRLPDDISLTISQEVIVYAGKSSGVISITKDQSFRCDAHLNKASAKTFDQQFPSKILQPKGSNIILSEYSVRIEIQDDEHFAAVSCSGKSIDNPENRQALMEFFKAGGIGLHIPPPQKVK